MKKTFLFSLSLSLLCAFSARAQLPASQTRQFWDDPQFKSRFMGTYGQLPDVEPTISSDESRVLQGIIPTIQDDPMQAIASLQSANNSGATAVYDFAIGNIYFQQGDLGNARRAYLAAIKKYPEFRRVYKNLGLLEVREGNLDEAVEYLGQAALLGDKDSRTYGLLGYCYLQQDACLPAESAYRQAMLFDPESLDWKLGLAQCLYAQEEYEETIALCSQLIHEDPDQKQYWLLQANCFLGTKQPLRAAESLEIVSRMGELDAPNAILLGDIYLNAGMPELALDAYQSAAALKQKPDVKSLIRSASIMAQLGANDEADALVDSIQQQYGDSLTKEQKVKLLNEEAKIARRREDMETAGAILAELVEMDPLNGDVMIEMAQYELAQGNEEKAEFYYQRALNLEKYKARALIEYAKLKVKQAKYSDAVGLLDESLSIESSSRIEDYRDRVVRAARSLN